MKTYIRHQQHKKNKHLDIKQKQQPQKYRIGTTSIEKKKKKKKKKKKLTCRLGHSGKQVTLTYVILWT